MRQAREALGLGTAEVAARLRVPHHVITGLEADDYSRLGAPVFVRNHVQAYARLLGIEVEPLVQAATASTAQPALVSMVPSSRVHHALEQVGRRAVYVVLTAVLVVPVFYIATQSPDAPTRVSLEPQPAAGPGGPGTQLELAVPLERPTLQDAVEVPETVVASMSPFRRVERQAPPTPTAPAPVGIELHFRGESWVEVFDRDGQRIEQALMRAGSRLSYEPGRVGRVTLGNAGVVDVLSDGETRDTSAFARANVARFEVSSDGRLVAVGG
ncbi:MAG: helix-turn-helix domain-containing protein [Lysobacteraceae bacterium]